MASVIPKCGQVDLSKASENVSDLQLIFKFRIFRKIGKICQFSQICAGVSTSTSSFRGLNSSFKQSISSSQLKLGLGLVMIMLTKTISQAGNLEKL